MEKQYVYMSRKDIIKYMAERGIDVSNKLMVRVVDYAGNPFAPEQTVYKCTYTDKITFKRCRFALYPNTVGYQYY